ncbi:MAG TPA: LPS export ABC transporter periplasmic protein LptC [Thermoanaerobaculia bacterium]|nr:LPS export ABC transporter periplasmic protein LptC [Thermoanaerobaculia bacterium]
MARRIPIRGLRNLLLLVMVLLVAGLSGLFLFGRAGREGLRRPAEEGEATQAGQGTALIGEDFDYTFTERERPIFRIRGDSIRADQGGTIFLDGVGLTLYDEEGRAYHVESRQASFNRESNEGRLLGNVILKGPAGLMLRTAQLNINEKGRVLVSPKPVALRYADMYTANAQRMRVNLDDEMFVLAGQTRVQSLPGAEIPMALTAERTVYDRKQKLLRAEGNATLRRGSEQVRSQRLSAHLTPDESGLQFVRAQFNVSGRLTGDSPTASVVRFTGRDLAVQMQPDAENQPRKVVLEGGEKNRAMIETTGAGPGGGMIRTLTALQIEGMLALGALTEAEAFGGVDLRETTRGGGQKEVRRATGMRAKAGFRGGELATVELINKVVFRDPQTRATGNRASLDLDSGRGEFFGEPVEAVSERGRMTAPRILYNVENQVLNAVGGVRAVMEQESDSELAGTPLGEGEGPVHVESREAFWRKEPQSFLFRGDVRAWRGENLMLTTELQGNQVEDTLTATGGVKTLWIPADRAVARAQGKPQPASSGASRAPVEVVAQEMVYREGGGMLTYTGSVRVVQEGKTLTCDRLDVDLAEDNKAEKMTCTGDTKLNDPKEGRQIAGQKAVYDLAAKRMEITGDKVTMRDREGNQVQGKRVIYFVDDGKVEVKGKDDTPATPAASAPSAAGTGSGE